jgi:hypothetical protein
MEPHSSCFLADGLQDAQAIVDSFGNRLEDPVSIVPIPLEEQQHHGMRDVNHPASSDLLKLEDKPKRPLNAYNLFFRFERERIINGETNRKVKAEDVIKICSILNKKSSQKRKHCKTHGKIGFEELARTIALQWKMLDQETKALFESVAAADKVRYKKEFDEWYKKQCFHEKASKSFEGLETASDVPLTIHPIQEASQLLPHKMTVSLGDSQQDSTTSYQDDLRGRDGADQVKEDIAKLKGEINEYRQICIRQAALLHNRQFQSDPSKAFSQTWKASIPHREDESSTANIDLHVLESESPLLSSHSVPELPGQVELPQATYNSDCAGKAVSSLDQHLDHIDPDLWYMPLDDGSNDTMF